jgi:3'-5' exoribonuclease
MPETVTLRKRPDDFAVQLKPGRAIDSLFAVFESRKQVGKSGSSFVRATLGDRTGAVTAMFFPQTEKDADEAVARLAKGGVVRVVGTLEDFPPGSGRVQLKVGALSGITALREGGFSADDFRRASPIAKVDLQRGFAEVRATMADVHLGGLWDAVFADSARRELFYRATAAKSNHHAYAGGLAEHTLEVVRIAAEAARHVPQANRDLCMVGALFHDIGKMEEYAENGFAYDVTDEGRLIGHMVFGVRLLDECVKRVPGFPRESHNKLANVILSHHGDVKQGWGSSKDPECLEAVVVHHADMISSRTKTMRFKESGWG